MDNLISYVLTEQKKSIAIRLVDFVKDNDFYEYQDNLEIGETDEETIENILSHLSDESYVEGVVQYLEQTKENIDNEPVYLSKVDKLLADVKALLPEEVPVYDRESEILYSVLHALKIDDIELDYDADGLVARDDDYEWSAALYGIKASDDQIVTVALSQVGNVGGQPYWSWYGFGSRVEWCACFVSWCANECGYIDTGIIPKFALCSDGANWFKNRGQWADNSHEPVAGTIIFFDWENDGETDHVGIVQKCENETVYTVEGNSGDSCRTKTYSVGSSLIYGYGIPAY